VIKGVVRERGGERRPTLKGGEGMSERRSQELPDGMLCIGMRGSRAILSCGWARLPLLNSRSCSNPVAPALSQQ